MNPEPHKGTLSSLRLKRNIVTVCIAAACEHGKILIAATDGAISYGEITADSSTMKGRFFADWLFMHSGEHSSADLIADQMRTQISADPSCLERKNIRPALRRAYRRHLSMWASDQILSPYDLDIDEFKKEGKNIFGEKIVADIALKIHNRAQEFNTQILMVGWGYGDNADHSRGKLFWFSIALNHGHCSHRQRRYRSNVSNAFAWAR